MRAYVSATAAAAAAAAALVVLAIAAHAPAVTASALASSSNFSACDPLVPEQCALPFPNNFYLRETALPGGSSELRVSLGNSTLPIDSSKKPIRADYGGWNTLDGFSPMPSIAAYLANASISNCARLWDIAASLAPDSPTVLLNADTGERIAHWVELDHISDNFQSGNLPGLGPNPRAIMMWAERRLNSSARYIVAMRSIVNTDGNAIAPSPAFAALRDGTPSSDPDVEGRRALFKDIFAKLTAAGVDTKSLQLAWDFTVGSRASVTSRMVSMRDDAMTRLPGPSGSPLFDITSIKDNVSDSIYREVQGTYQVPWYLNHASILPQESDRLVLNSAGVPQFQHYFNISFTVLVPRSLVENGTTGMLLQYGHGLFGDQSEVTEGYLDDEANEYGYVLGAVDWMGLSAYDEVGVSMMLAHDLSDFQMMVDRCTQGMLNALVFMRLMKTGLATAPELTFNGKAVIDPTRTAYDGNSQGGILGSVYMSLSTDVTRGVIGVGGAPYGLLLPRSVDFGALFLLLKVRYTEPLDRVVIMQAIQLLWDRLEPAGYIDAITENPLPNTPSHRVLIHYGLGDAQVTWLGGQQIGRTVGASMFKSNIVEGNITLHGFPFVGDTAVVTEGNVIMGWEFPGVPVVPFTNTPPSKKTDTHEDTRRTKTAQEQMHLFLTTGKIINTCGGPCHNVSMA